MKGLKRLLLKSNLRFQFKGKVSCYGINELLELRLKQTNLLHYFNEFGQREKNFRHASAMSFRKKKGNFNLLHYALWKPIQVQ